MNGRGADAEPAWAREQRASQAGLVGRITPAGAITQLALPIAGSAPDGIAAGSARTIWVAETGADAIARITLP